MLKAIHAQEDKEAARQKTAEVVKKLRTYVLRRQTNFWSPAVTRRFPNYAFPATHWRYVRTNNALEQLNREIRRRTRVVGSFPDGHAALMLVSGRLRYMAGQKWVGMQGDMNMKEEESE